MSVHAVERLTLLGLPPKPPKPKPRPPFGQDFLDATFGTVEAAREYQATVRRTGGWRERRRRRLLTKAGRRAARKGRKR
jgi:hypothetical protein